MSGAPIPTLSVVLVATPNDDVRDRKHPALGVGSSEPVTVVTAIPMIEARRTRGFACISGRLRRA